MYGLQRLTFSIKGLFIMITDIQITPGLGHGESAPRAVYSHVVSSKRMPFEKCSPVLDKLFRFRVFEYVLLKAANASMKLASVGISIFWIVSDSHIRSLCDGYNDCPDRPGDKAGFGQGLG